MTYPWEEQTQARHPMMPVQKVNSVAPIDKDDFQ